VGRYQASREGGREPDLLTLKGYADEAGVSGEDLIDDGARLPEKLPGAKHGRLKASTGAGLASLPRRSRLSLYTERSQPGYLARVVCSQDKDAYLNLADSEALKIPQLSDHRFLEGSHLIFAVFIAGP